MVWCSCVGILNYACIKIIWSDNYFGYFFPKIGWLFFNHWNFQFCSVLLLCGVLVKMILHVQFCSAFLYCNVLVKMHLHVRFSTVLSFIFICTIMHCAFALQCSCWDAFTCTIFAEFCIAMFPLRCIYMLYFAVFLH